MSIRQRILLIAVLPIIALTVFSGWILSERWSESEQMQSLMTGGHIIARLTDLVTNVQRERGRSALFLGSKGTQYGQELTEQRQATDAQRDLLKATIQPALLAQLQPAVAKAVEEADTALSNLDKLRQVVSNQSISAGDSLNTYSGMIDKLLAVSLFIVRDVDHAQVKNSALALSFLQRASEQAGITRGVGSAGMAGGGFAAGQLFQLASMEAEEAEFIKLFEVYAPAEIQTAFAAVASSAEATEVSRLRQMILATKPGEPVKNIDSAQWFKAATARIDMLVGVQGQLLQLIVSEVEGAHDRAVWQLIMTAAVAALFIAGGLGLGIATMRSVARPILAMALSMRRLATGDLVVEIPNTRRKDEIGQMAEALLVFKEAAIAKLRLEEEADTARGAAEAERAGREAEKAEEARQDQFAIEALAQGLERLSSGDLIQLIDMPFSSKTERLRMDFNASVQKLKQTMLAIVSSTGAIHSGTEEISSAADDLSRRTEQQAASLEETAAALEEITATVKKSAEGASHAREVVAAADEDARKSALVVRQAVEAMDAIAKSAQQISQIIGVIDEIAFQTNLLALNAGVEAARAGDAGRGFAVVASEVRALAQRSAEAAKEIKGLITASTRQVESGVKLVGETGASLERIMAQVAEINGVVGEIAVGAKEQSTGVGEVNIAINQMDQMTQQNAAMVEESTAATHSLSQEIAQLSELIGQFKVGQTERIDSIRRELQKGAPQAFRQKPGVVATKGAHTETRNAASQPVRGMPKVKASNGGSVDAGEDGWKECERAS